MILKPFFYVSIILALMGSNTSKSNDEALMRENQALKAEIERLKKERDFSKTEAVLELSKMNVVYRGLFNPIKISMPGAIKIEATAKGLTKVDDLGNYKLAPSAGRTIEIMIEGTMKNGQVVRDTKTLRIKGISSTKSLFLGRACNRCELKLTKEEVKKGKVSLKIEDFLYDSPMEVMSFKIKLHKGRAIQMQGNRLNEAAKRLVNQLKRGDKVQIFDIQMKYAGLRICKINPIAIEIVG